MSNFKNTEQDFGKVKPGKKLEAIFSLNSNSVGPTDFSTTCHCIKPKFDKEKNRVIVSYTVLDIPYHLVQNGIRELPQSKIATAIFADGTREELKLTYIISK